MMLACAMDGGDLAAAELVQNLGAEGAWAKIIEGALGEPITERAIRIKIDVVEPAAKAARMGALAAPGQYRRASEMDCVGGIRPSY